MAYKFSIHEMLGNYDAILDRNAVLFSMYKRNGVYAYRSIFNVGAIQIGLYADYELVIFDYKTMNDA